MFQHWLGRRLVRPIVFVWAFAVSEVGASAQPAAQMSPRPERVAPREAWRLAEAIAAEKDACEVMIGSGGSMLPLYPDRTVLVVERVPLAKLQRGMTVVFIGDRGRPVAHTLIEKTPSGWVAQGLANDERDRTLVRERNYLGTVVRAFAPVVGGVGGTD